MRYKHVLIVTTIIIVTIVIIIIIAITMSSRAPTTNMVTAASWLILLTWGDICKYMIIRGWSILDREYCDEHPDMAQMIFEDVDDFPS